MGKQNEHQRDGWLMKINGKSWKELKEQTSGCEQKNRKKREDKKVIS